MDWSALGKRVAQAAPILGGAIGPGGAAVGGLVASLFGVENDPDAINQALDADPKAAIKLRELENEHKRELTKLQLEATTAHFGQINKTMRAEAESEDPYVRRWRPTFGYILAASFGLLIVAVCVLLVSVPFADPKALAQAANMITALSGVLMTLFGLGLTVLGVNIDRRSKDKQVAAGQQPAAGLLGSLAQRLPGGGK